MKRFTILVLAILLSACTGTQPNPAEPTAEAFVTSTLPPTSQPLPTSYSSPVTPTPTTNPSILAQLFPNSNAGNELTRMDQQGMVIVEVTPMNFGMPGDSIIFEVSMNTHSVDLSMDLAKLSTLSTDTGRVIQAVSWDAPIGGHHVSGELVFPALVDGVSVFDGAAKFTLQIKDVDAPMRTFEWSLQ